MAEVDTGSPSDRRQSQGRGRYPNEPMVARGSRSGWRLAGHTVSAKQRKRSRRQRRWLPAGQLYLLPVGERRRNLERPYPRMWVSSDRR
jgi:hypothetical protein